MTRLALLSSVAMGCLVTAILVVNNLRDVDTDRAAGKRTLAVRIGKVATRWEYTALIVVAYVVPVSCGGRDYPSLVHCSRGRLVPWQSTLCDRSGVWMVEAEPGAWRDGPALPLVRRHARAGIIL